MFDLSVGLLRRRAAPCLALAALVAGCASAGARPMSAGSGSRNIITQAEIEQLNARNLYEVVQTLRPEYLRGRGVTSASDDPRKGGLPAVFQNGSLFGSIDSLNNISPGIVREIRFLNARDATTRYGTNVPNGVIEVFTK